MSLSERRRSRDNQKQVPTAYIGLGANLPGPAGSPEDTLAAAVSRLGSLGRVEACSSLYSTSPVGFADQPRFLNAVLALETRLSPHELLEALLDVEREFGRDRSAGFANGPRTLDLDVLLYGDLVASGYDLKIPHPRLAERAFVLVPLREIAPQAIDPRTGSAVSQYLENLFPDPKGANDAVVQVESSLWSADPGRAGQPRNDGSAGAGADRDCG
ncbi:MAG TPA: 2-amino-4-hydroxy-6-hydroxymethyldihydropteridine diphosphokinase [Terracidiphilus sp.]|jgi:2-amino-4-hydroxy-6-hydroxymethyldihydropteridine diphosphokinase